MSDRNIKVDYLARVEGEGGINIKIVDNKVKNVKFRIFEPPRLYEAFLRGRKFTEAPDITARICGICPIAYQMSSVNAMEQAIGVTVGGMLRELRRLIYCGEWIESHVLHAFMLHAPDYLGYDDVLQLAKDHGDLVKNVLQLKKYGNEIVTLLGGREIHPINVRVGGFYKTPRKKDLLVLAEKLKWCLDFTVETTKWAVKNIPIPEFENNYEYISLKHPNEYPFNDGRIVSNKGLDFDVKDFDDFIQEEHVRHSTSLHTKVKKRGAYHVGPLARFNNCFDQLGPISKALSLELGLKPTINNPFLSIVIRLIETVYALEEALRIIGIYEEPDKPAVECVPKAGIGHGASEAPRGILYHQYRIDNNGVIQTAKIVPPTAQNQKIIEEDLSLLVPPNLKLTDDKLTWLCEQAVRNYDPCISCSCHAIKVNIERE